MDEPHDKPPWWIFQPAPTIVLLPLFGMLAVRSPLPV
jgi:hypothetical protein